MSSSIHSVSSLSSRISFSFQLLKNICKVPLASDVFFWHGVTFLFPRSWWCSILTNHQSIVFAILCLIICPTSILHVWTMLPLGITVFSNHSWNSVQHSAINKYTWQIWIFGYQWMGLGRSNLSKSRLYPFASSLVFNALDRAYRDSNMDYFRLSGEKQKVYDLLQPWIQCRDPHCFFLGVIYYLNCLINPN